MRVAEVTVFLTALALGPAFFFSARAPYGETVVIMIAAIISLFLGAGAVLGWLYANSRVSAPSSWGTFGRMLGGAGVGVFPICLVLMVIPSLVMSEAASNETSAIVSLETYASAQVRFHRNDHYGIGKRVHANPKDGAGFPDLYEIGGPDSGGTVLGLIDRHFAEATSPERARCGYWFVDITGDANGPYDFTKQFGLCAVPAEHGRSGRSTFIIDASGKVYLKWTEGRPVRIWPDVYAEEWIPVGR